MAEIETDQVISDGSGSEHATSETEGNKPLNMTSEQFNKAMIAKERAFEKRLAKQQEEFQQLLKQHLPAPKEEPQLSRTAELERQIRDLSKNLQDRDGREKADNLRRSTERAIKAAGVAPEFIEHAAGFLLDTRKAVRYDEDGQLVMTVNGVQYDSLDEGMVAWGQTTDAKLFKTPSQARGSGDGNRRANVGPTTIVNRQTGEIMLKRRADADKFFDPKDPKSTLTYDTKVQLRDIIGQKLLAKK